MRNIDFIYMINLDERPEKFILSSLQLCKYGISPYRFSAVNGWELPIEKIQELGVKYESWMRSDLPGTCYFPEDCGYSHEELVAVPGRRYFYRGFSRGGIGIILSHLSVLKDALDSGYETIWVLEDDIEIIRDPLIIPDLIDELDLLVGRDGWDILFTDRDTKGADGNYVICLSGAPRPNFQVKDQSIFAYEENISHNFRRLGARYGAYSMIVNRSGMQKLYEFVKQYDLFLPFDMEYTLPPGIKLITVRDDIVSTLPRALSDNRYPLYKKNTQ